MNIELNHTPNFERLVLGCIDAHFCNQLFVGIMFVGELLTKPKKNETEQMINDLININ